MADQYPINSPRPPKPPSFRPFRPGLIIDDQMPRRLIVQLDTNDITADQYEAAVREWLSSESPPTLAFQVAREILAGIVGAR